MLGEGDGAKAMPPRPQTLSFGTPTLSFPTLIRFAPPALETSGPVFQEGVVFSLLEVHLKQGRAGTPGGGAWHPGNPRKFSPLLPRRFRAPRPRWFTDSNATPLRWAQILAKGAPSRRVHQRPVRPEDRGCPQAAQCTFWAHTDPGRAKPPDGLHCALRVLALIRSWIRAASPPARGGELTFHCAISHTGMAPKGGGLGP